MQSVSTEDITHVPHSFEQEEGAPVHVCRVCGRWPLHHLHDQDKGKIGDLSLPCNCEDCQGRASG
jgi:uncharacterized cysteine cluster protein YcgN (CxxCxxCC family)